MQGTLHIDNLKVEKDNACDKMDACEEAMKTAKVRLFLQLQNWQLDSLSWKWEILLKTPKNIKNKFWYIQIRAQKGEDEVAELDAKAKQLETELDLTAEKLGYVSLQAKTLNQALMSLILTNFTQLEEKEKALSAAELEMNALTRLPRHLK